MQALDTIVTKTWNRPPSNDMSFEEDNRLPQREWEDVTVGQFAFGYAFLVTLLTYVLAKLLPKASRALGSPQAGIVDKAHSVLQLISSDDKVSKAYWHVLMYGFGLLYMYICDRSPWVDHGTKTYSRDIYLFLNGIFILWSLLDLRKSPTNAPLNRDQTEEWKGWMQFAFLAYHYFDAREAYNAIRVFVGCYVWMTGFGNFSYFYTKNDYSFVRLFQMMWRLNFLVLGMCIVMNRPYILYYIVPLHTTWFLFVYTFMRVKRKLNYSEYGMKIKFVCGAVVVFVLWEFKSLFTAVFTPLLPVLGKDGSMHEWFFRSFLDHYVPLWGMLFAFQYPLYEKTMVFLEKQTKLIEWAVKGGVAIVLVSMSYFWLVDIFAMEKYTYNRHHPYFEILPIVTYIWLRNITPGWRSWYSHTLTRLGQITLETYLCQFHVFLADDAAHLVVLIPNYPFLNCLLVTTIYVFVAKKLFHATIELRSIAISRTTTTIAILKGCAIALGVGLVLSLFGGFMLYMIPADLFSTALIVSIPFGMLALVFGTRYLTGTTDYQPLRPTEEELQPLEK